MRKNYQESLNKDLCIDVLIIGGGITGLTTAYFLRDKNLNTVLIEKNHIGSNATANTTGKLTFMQKDIYNLLDKRYQGIYLNSQLDAINIVKDIVNTNNIECNLESTNSYIYTNCCNNINKLNKEREIYTKLNVKNTSINKLPIKIPLINGIKTNNSYVFHPLKYLYALKRILINSNVKIYENTTAYDIRRDGSIYIVKVNDKVIKTKYVVMATGYPFFIKPYYMPFKVSVEKSYIIAGLVNKNKKFQAISIDKDIISIRYYTNNKKTYLIVCLNSNKLNYNNDEKENYRKNIRKVKELFDLDIKYYFINQDIITSDHLPLIGRVNNSNLLIATGYNKWGMTNGTIAGKVLSDIILNNKNKYIDLFRLNRGINLEKIKNLTIYNYNNIKNYILSKLNNSYSLVENVRIETIDNIKYGVYRDKKGIEYRVKNLCPHMKCNLIFNIVEKTWDCPCHGSKFDIYGNSIYGPSVYDIKIDN